METITFPLIRVGLNGTDGCLAKVTGHLGRKVLVRDPESGREFCMDLSNASQERGRHFHCSVFLYDSQVQESLAICSALGGARADLIGRLGEPNTEVDQMALRMDISIVDVEGEDFFTRCLTSAMRKEGLSVRIGSRTEEPSGCTVS